MRSSDFPRAQLYVKTHPDVLAGKKKGYLTEEAKRCGAELIAEDVAPLSLLAQADVVYCVTSQMGFEALMLGKRVYCFGMPFYANWGVTHDALSCPRRIKKRTFLEVFAAAYLLYARYVNPVTGERCDIHDAIARLAVQRGEEREEPRISRLLRVFSLEASARSGLFAEHRGLPSDFSNTSSVSRGAVASAVKHGGGRSGMVVQMRGRNTGRVLS